MPYYLEHVITLQGLAGGVSALFISLIIRAMLRRALKVRVSPIIIGAITIIGIGVGGVHHYDLHTTEEEERIRQELSQQGLMEWGTVTAANTTSWRELSVLCQGEAYLADEDYVLLDFDEMTEINSTVKVLCQK